VFLALVKHLEEHQNTLRSSGKITTIVYHYILTGDEPAIPGHSNIYSAVKRPALRPVVTDLPGIRSAFCFRVAGETTLAYRELSCRCSKCLARLWNECKNEDAGEWKRVDMTLKAASQVSKTRGLRTTMSMSRVKLAKAAQPGECIAMESADDEEGFRWWLAKAEGPAVQYTGRKKTENGVTFVDGGYYISLRYYERFPPSSPDTFKLSAKVWTENAEGLISRQVAVSDASVRRFARGNAFSLASLLPLIVTMDDAERTRLDACPHCNMGS